jgi:hypothetical protein
VRASIHATDGIDGRALQLDFDLAGTAGYAIADRTLPLDLPANYEISFYVRADAPVNNFQFKLTDAGGDNVWWFNRPNFTFPREWREVRIRKRQIEFAWGPTTDRTLKHAARLEFVVAAGQGGGAGSVRLSRLAVRELPPVPTIWPMPAVRASSDRPGADRGVRGRRPTGTAWRSDPGGGRRKVSRSISGSGAIRRHRLHWLDKEFASRYAVQVSDDGAQWRTLRSVGEGSGGNDALALPEAESVTCGCRCKTASGPTVLPKWKSRTRIMANRPTRSSKWSRATRRAAISPAAFPASRLTGRWSASMAAATTRCCRPTVRSRPGRGSSRSSRSSSPAAS